MNYRETAKANGREPYAWLRHVLQRLPYAKTADDYEALLPWNLSALELVEEAIRAWFTNGCGPTITNAHTWHWAASPPGNGTP